MEKKPLPKTDLTALLPRERAMFRYAGSMWGSFWLFRVMLFVLGPLLRDYNTASILICIWFSAPLGILIAAVAGIGAALYMALFRSLLRAMLIQAPAAEAAPATLTRTLAFLNDYIALEHGRDNMFATMFVGVLDPQTGEISYLNAGHDPPMLHRRAAGTIGYELMCALAPRVPVSVVE